jgi:hypothetical protein
MIDIRTPPVALRRNKAPFYSDSRCQGPSGVSTLSNPDGIRYLDDDGAEASKIVGWHPACSWEIVRPRVDESAHDPPHTSDDAVLIAIALESAFPPPSVRRWLCGWPERNSERGLTH